MKNNIILASASPRRVELLKQIGINFNIRPANINENLDITDPQELVKELSRLKATDILKQFPDKCIIAADTSVFACNQILGKPKNREEAAEMLKMLSGNKHLVYTGVTVADKNEIITDISATEVYFRQLTSEDVDKYLQTGEYKDKAGSYGIQGYAARFVKKINGCYFNVVGLPLSLLDEILCKKGLI